MKTETLLLWGGVGLAAYLLIKAYDKNLQLTATANGAAGDAARAANPAGVQTQSWLDTFNVSSLFGSGNAAAPIAAPSYDQNVSDMYDSISPVAPSLSFNTSTNA